MKIYLDSASVNEINEATQTGLIDGITTNPTLISKTGNNFEEEIREIINIL
jgi:transaldolase